MAKTVLEERTGVITSIIQRSQKKDKHEKMKAMETDDDRRLQASGRGRRQRKIMAFCISGDAAAHYPVSSSPPR